MSATPEVGSSNISFSGLRESWGTESYVGGSDPGSGSNSNISLSEFREATFTNDTSVPDGSDEEISIEDDFKDKTFGAAVLTFPVTSNPSIQWIVGGMEAEKSGVSTISGNDSGDEETIDPEEYWSGISIPGTNQWITSEGKTVTRNSYTNADSDTIYYLTIPVATNFTTKINTSGDMASTGFTGWWVMLGPSATNSWWRPFSYRGIASGDTESISDDQVYQSSTGQYRGPAWFFNSAYSTRMEFRKPTDSTTGNGLSAWPLTAGGKIWEGGANSVWILIWKISSGGITKYTSCVRDKSNGFDKPDAAGDEPADRENEDTFASAQTNFQGTTSFGLKSSTNVGKPWFNDSRFSGNNDAIEIVNLISSGWANREYTDSESNLLRDKLKDLYFGVARGTA